MRGASDLPLPSSHAGPWPLRWRSKNRFRCRRENSAVNQYTGALPLTAGDREAHNHQGRNVSPGKVIGAKNAKKLDQRGAAGRATAKFAADTAPHPTAWPGHRGRRHHQGQPGPGAEHERGRGQLRRRRRPAGRPGWQQHLRTGSRQRPRRDHARRARRRQLRPLRGPLEAATGGSGDGMGLFLPLLIIAAIAWAIAYTVRQRRPVS